MSGWIPVSDLITKEIMPTRFSFLSCNEIKPPQLTLLLSSIFFDLMQTVSTFDRLISPGKDPGGGNFIFCYSSFIEEWMNAKKETKT